jgi:hypothetical protein
MINGRTPATIVPMKRKKKKQKKKFVRLLGDLNILSAEFG